MCLLYTDIFLNNNDIKINRSIKKQYRVEREKIKDKHNILHYNNWQVTREYDHQVQISYPAKTLFMIPFQPFQLWIHIYIMLQGWRRWREQPSHNPDTTSPLVSLWESRWDLQVWPSRSIMTELVSPLEACFKMLWTNATLKPVLAGRRAGV